MFANYCQFSQTIFEQLDIFLVYTVYLERMHCLLQKTLGEQLEEQLEE